MWTNGRGRSPGYVAGVKVLHVGWGFRPFRFGGLIQYAEDLMDAQVARGHEVAYFFAGRHFPFTSTPRLKRWERRGIAMYEVLNNTLVFGGHLGTPTPEDDVDHEPSERFFRRALAEARPDVVHVQELLGLPSSLLEIARAEGVPVVFTLQDYYALCPTLKLYDTDRNICLRVEPGPQCRRCSRDAPRGPHALVQETVRYQETRVLQSVPGLARVPRPRRVVAAVRAVQGAFARSSGGERVAPPELPPPSAYQRRRDVNVERLGRVDRLVAMSTRVAEIYTDLGVDPANLRTLHLTLDHIAAIEPKRMPAVERPVRFVTLAGCASEQKGAQVVLGALAQLEAQGFTAGDLMLSVYGFVDPAALGALQASPLARVEGSYAPEEQSAVLERFHVGIVPSVWEEAYGYVGVEMLAKGVPVIGNAVGVITDYVRDGETGWLNRDCSPTGLAAIMAGIVQRPDQVAQLNDRLLAERASIVKPLDRHVEEIDALYAEVAATRAAA